MPELAMRSPLGCDLPATTHTTRVRAPAHAGHCSRVRSSSPDALRHGSTGATAMRNSSASAIGIVMRSKYGPPDRDARRR